MRGKGEGSFRKNENTGLWESRIELPSANGKRRRLTKRGKHKAPLLAYHNAKLAELREHGDLPSASPTVEAFLNRWLREKAKHVAPNTMTNYRSVATKYLIPGLGKKKVAALSPNDIRAVTNQVLKDGRSSTYALNVHRVLSTALTDAVEQGIRTTNPAKRMKAPKKGKTVLEALTLDESLRLMDHIAHEPDGARWAAALLTGVRRGEAIGLENDRVTDTLDLSWQLQRIIWQHGCGALGDDRRGKCGFKRAASCPQKHVTLPPDYEHRHVEGGLYLVRPKSDDGRRRIPLVDPLRSIIARHMSLYPHDRFVFTRPDGRPHDPSDDSAEWKAVLERAGIDKNVRLHDLRHTAVLLLRAAGVEWDVIRMILGHATIMQSMAYLPAAEADDPRLVAAMESLSMLLQPRQLEA